MAATVTSLKRARPRSPQRGAEGNGALFDAAPAERMTDFFLVRRRVLNSRLGWALAVSLLVHGTLLATLPGLSLHIADKPRVLQVKLPMPVETSAGQQDPAAEKSAKAPKAESQPLPESRAYQFRNSGDARRDATSVRQVAAAPVLQAAPAADPLPGVSLPQAPPAAAQPRPEGELPSRAATGVAEEPNLTTLSSFAASLSAMLGKYQQYPRLAQIRRWEGKVEIRLYYARKGAITSMVITHSSGHEILDQQALEIVKQVAPHAAVPEALLGGEFTLVIPITFRLEDS